MIAEYDDGFGYKGPLQPVEGVGRDPASVGSRMAENFWTLVKPLGQYIYIP